MQIEYSKWKMESFRKRFIRGANAIMQSARVSLYIVFDLSFLEKFLLSFQVSYFWGTMLCQRYKNNDEVHSKNILFNNILEFQNL